MRMRKLKETYGDASANAKLLNKLGKDSENHPYYENDNLKLGN